MSGLSELNVLGQLNGLVAGIVFSCLSISITLGALALAIPGLRTWPPPRTTLWPRPVLAIIGPIFPVGIYAQLPLGMLDWNSFALDSWLRFVPGGALLVWGGFWSLWGIRTLGMHATQGNESELIDRGAYRYCRNPQYVGSIAALFGYALICNSSLALLASGLSALSFIHLPFVEEPWLRERLGPSFDDYCARVPRFLPFSSR